VYLLLVVDQASVGYQATGRKAGKRALTSIAAFLMVEFRMIVSTMILDVKLRETCEWRDKNVISRRKAFCPSVLAWRALRWWLVAGLATRMAGLACARAHRVTEGALRVRDTYDSM
jgi:hypothetical protein